MSTLLTLYLECYISHFTSRQVYLSNFFKMYQSFYKCHWYSRVPYYCLCKMRNLGLNTQKVVLFFFISCINIKKYVHRNKVGIIFSIASIHVLLCISNTIKILHPKKYIPQVSGLFRTSASHQFYLNFTSILISTSEIPDYTVVKTLN